MNNICTSIEQSLKIIELGFDINTADMYYPNRVGSNNYPLPIECKMNLPLLSQEIPAWSLSALLKLIPPGNILLRDVLNRKYKCINKVDSDYYDNPLDAAFEMVCQLKI